MEKKSRQSTMGMSELFSVFGVVVALNLVLVLSRLQGEEIRRFTANSAFEVKREGCVGEAARWSFFYSSPVIGILTNPQRKLKNGKASETVPVSVVRMMQASGVQVIPISYSLPKDELRTMVKSVNGLFIPGSSNNILKGRHSRHRQDRVAQISRWLSEDTPTPVLTTTEDHSLCHEMPLRLKQGNVTWTPHHRVTTCNHVVKHKEIPLNQTPQFSFTQEDVNRFVSNEVRRNKNSFESAVSFHVNNIENFPILIEEGLGSVYVVENRRI